MSKQLNETKFKIWEGIYPDFKSALVHAKGNGFCGNTYIKKSIQNAKECLQDLETGKPIKLFHKQRSTYLPITASMMLKNMKKINILDFGGGLGIGYMSIIESLSIEPSTVNYTILELEDVCRYGSSLHKGKINYFSKLPEKAKYNLIHAASSLQYVEDWKLLISKFNNYKPEYILLSDVFAGNINSFVTLQNYYESKIPHWFLNINELLSIFEKNGYELVFKSYVESKRYDSQDIIPMDNFQEEFRIKYSMHLLFSRINDE